MANFEYEYSDKDYQLIGEQTQNSLTTNDYVKLTVYIGDNIATRNDGTNAIFYSSLSPNAFKINVSPNINASLDNFTERYVGGIDVGAGIQNENDFKIYQNPNNQIYIKPNDIFDEFELPQGNYEIKIDFLNQVNLPLVESQFLATLPFPEFKEEFDVDNNGTYTGLDLTYWNDYGRPDIRELLIHLGDWGSEIEADAIGIENYTYPDYALDWSSLDDIPAGASDNDSSRFFNTTGTDIGTENLTENYQFVIKEVSTSRKEVRLKLLNRDIGIQSDSDKYLISSIKEKLDNQFNYLLNIGIDHIPIMNYQFDAITDGVNNQSIILKLYEPLPINRRNLSWVTIEEEVLITQTLPIYYFSDVERLSSGGGLTPDDYENWINPTDNPNYENYNNLTSSISTPSLNNLISGSIYDYPNLNTDFIQFENHTFFGSAKRKLINFRKKVETIQNYYSEISSSLTVSSSISGDSDNVIKQRKNLFTKVNEEIKSFTPYERFLYFDGQSESTASAPGLGKNYADTIPVSSTQNFEQLNGFDGLDTVYKNTNLAVDGTVVDLFTDKFKVQNKPFFNYSSSIYLSFLLKGSNGISLDWRNENTIHNPPFPEDTLYQNNVLNPNVTGSEYRRYIFEASMSYFVPSSVVPNFNIDNIGDFGAGSTQIEILSSNVKTGSNKIIDGSGVYQNYTTVVTGSGIPFEGSVMPAGELFKILYLSGSDNGAEVTQSLVTDVKISLENPSDVLPFDNLYHTSSISWSDWYDTLLQKAEDFDTDNIHSLQNNLPIFIQNDSSYDEFREFLSLQGEQYDIVRNHVDSLGTIHDRGYKKTNSPPTNTYPMLLDNMGYEAINPFSGSLSDSLGSYLSGVTSIDDIKNNTWRKTLNNLLYIYKSKGTKNSVRALLNVYGYPPDVLKIQEFGGSNQENQNPIENDTSPPDDGIDIDLQNQTGSFDFTLKQEKLYNYKDNKPERNLGINWWMDEAEPNTIEFIYKHITTPNTQTILESSGSGDETLWDLRLVTDNDGVSSSLEFRLNNTYTGSSDIATNSVSMSTDYTIKHAGQLFNIMLQRLSSSISGSGTNEYRLHTTLQDGASIKTYNYVTMSISGGLTEAYITGGDVMTSSVAGRNYFANQNWVLTGSRTSTDYENLIVGTTLSSSISQIKSWNTALSMSRFRQHTLNKFSTTGNSIDSHRKELIYHYRLNENYTSASISSSTQKLDIIDASPTTTFKNYSFKISGSLVTDSLLYGFDKIDVIQIGNQDNTEYRTNDNKVIISPPQAAVGNLSADKPAIVFDKKSNKPLFNTSVRLELMESPQDKINQFILNNMDSFNFEKFYGNPKYEYSSSYTDLDNLRNNFFDSHPITLNVNKFIKAYENISNNSIVKGIQSLVPARSTMSDEKVKFGVMIKPTILEKQKYEREEHSIEINPNSPSGSISFVENTEYKITSLTSTYEQPKSGSISMGNSYTTSSEYSTPPFLELNGITSSIESEKLGSIDVLYYNSNNDKRISSNVEVAKSGLISLGNTYITGSYTTPPFLQKNGITSSIVLPKSGTIDYASRANASFVNIHDSWGVSHTTGSDTHFINYAGGTGSRGNHNVAQIDTRNKFRLIGDLEVYSGSVNIPNDFTNHHNLHNREILSDDFHGDIIYESYINGNPGNQAGRAIGKTRYFSQSLDSNGNITDFFPANHVSKFSQPFKERMIEGTQNTNPGRLNVQYEDYSTASFYRVEVTGGENEIIVNTGEPSLGGDNKIIRG